MKQLFDPPEAATQRGLPIVPSVPSRFAIARSAPCRKPRTAEKVAWSGLPANATSPPTTSVNRAECLRGNGGADPVTVRDLAATGALLVVPPLKVAAPTLPVAVSVESEPPVLEVSATADNESGTRPGKKRNRDATEKAERGREEGEAHARLHLHGDTRRASALLHHGDTLQTAHAQTESPGRRGQRPVREMTAPGATPGRLRNR